MENCRLRVSWMTSSFQCGKITSFKFEIRKNWKPSFCFFGRLGVLHAEQRRQFFNRSILHRLKVLDWDHDGGKRARGSRIILHCVLTYIKLLFLHGAATSIPTLFQRRETIQKVSTPNFFYRLKRLSCKNVD